jgi:hypothetical protein
LRLRLSGYCYLKVDDEDSRINLIPRSKVLSSGWLIR